MGRHQASVKTGRLWRIAVLAAAGVVSATSYAEAAVFWSDSDPGISGPGPSVPQRGQKPRRHADKKIEARSKAAAKPQGPLVIAISINKQNMKVYDANGFFAETPISTGMAGHPTPTGVFSVIQKQKLHHSNIYSGAPMPFMQRITWSGIAIHAGVLPGYPASHGCIRMPMAFAVKMYGWTKMGARVVVTPGEMSPASFSHPLLVAEKVVPQPVAAAEEPKTEPKTDAPVAVKSDKAADVHATVMPATADTATVTAEANLELKSTIGHSGGVKPGMGETSASSSSLREQTHTADASASSASDTMSDATSASKASPHEVAAAGIDSESSTTSGAVKTSDASAEAKPEADPATAKSGEVASSEVKSVETKPSEAATAETKPEASAGDTPKAVEKTADVPSESVKTVPDVRPVAADVKKGDAQKDDAKKDQGRLSDADKGDRSETRSDHRRGAKAQRTDRGVRQPQRLKALCAAEFRAAI